MKLGAFVRDFLSFKKGKYDKKGKTNEAVVSSQTATKPTFRFSDDQSVYYKPSADRPFTWKVAGQVLYVTKEEFKYLRQIYHWDELQDLLDNDTVILINPTGEFVKGGAYADSGLTGRKIICDTYGGLGRHGGGAFSGKDVSKVDRLAAYYARFVAKNVVASGLAKKCEVQVAYAIGVDKPVSINVDTLGTSAYTNEELEQAVKQLFNFKPKSMKQEIISDDIKFKNLAEYGHVGRSDISVPWERTNKAYLFKVLVYKLYGKKKRINT